MTTNSSAHISKLFFPYAVPRQDGKRSLLANPIFGTNSPIISLNRATMTSFNHSLPMTGGSMYGLPGAGTSIPVILLTLPWRGRWPATRWQRMKRTWLEGLVAMETKYSSHSPRSSAV